MPTPSTLRPCPPASPHEQPDAPLLRDLVGRHAELLAQLLQEHLAARSAGAGRDFQAGAAVWREQGLRRFSSWLFGITLGLLREGGADAARVAAGEVGAGHPGAGHPGASAPRQEHPDAGALVVDASHFAGRLAQTLPSALTDPLLTLARSGLDDTRCALFLCKPAAAVAPGEPNRIQT